MRARTLFLAPVAVVSALAFMACTAKPENSPVIRKKFAEVDQMNQKMNEVQVALGSVSSDLRNLSDQISEVRALNPDTAGGTDIVKRIEALETRLNGSSGAVTSVANTSRPSAETSSTTTIASLENEPSTLNAKLAVPAEPVVTKVSNSLTSTPKAATTTKKATEAVKKVAETSKKKAASVAKPGRYYRVQNGETIEAIASKNGISVDAIRKANKLPGGSKVPAGQNLYLPGKS